MNDDFKKVLRIIKRNVTCYPEYEYRWYNYKGMTLSHRKATGKWRTLWTWRDYYKKNGVWSY